MSGAHQSFEEVSILVITDGVKGFGYSCGDATEMDVGCQDGLQFPSIKTCYCDGNMCNNSNILKNMPIIFLVILISAVMMF